MNPQVLNADAVMMAVRQNQIPGSWQVFRGRVAFHMQQLLGGVLILVLGFVGIMYLLLNPRIAIVPGYGSNDSPIDPGPFTIARTVDFVVLAILLLVGLWLCFSSSSQLTVARDQALVLMPDGFVISTKNPVAYAYAAMQGMSARNNRGTITFNITPVGGAQRQSFRLDGRFGNAKQIATQILAGRAEWQRAHPTAQPQQPPQPPLPGPAR